MAAYTTEKLVRDKSKLENEVDFDPTDFIADA